MKKKYLAIIVVLVVSLIAFSGCQQSEGVKVDRTDAAIEVKIGETAYPISFTDGRGNEIVIDQEPERIVSLAPAMTETLYALGAGDKVKGRTDYCYYPEEALGVESIGNFNSPNLEKIIQLAPDIILSSDFVSDEMTAQLEALGAKVIIFNPTSIDGIFSNIIQIGEMVNANDNAKELIEAMTIERETLIEKTAGVDKQRSVFVDIGGFYSAGPGSMMDAMLRELNAINIASDSSSQWAQLSTEEIIADNPDVYISLFTKAEDIKATPGFDKINAIKNDQLVYINDQSEENDMISRSGPRIIKGMALMAEAIYPEQF